MDKTIYMAQMEVVRPPDTIKTILGSCVGVALFDRRGKLFGLTHIMLPKSEEAEPKAPAKFANTAIPALLKEMGIPISTASQLRAKIAGGANMFSSIVKQKILQIGEQNIEAVKRILGELSISIVAEDCGGNTGREMIVDSQSGKIWVKISGQQPREL